MSDSLNITVSDFQDYITHGAGLVTPRSLLAVFSELPEIREQIADAELDGFPGLREQLTFLADVLEAFGPGDELDLPYSAAAEACFGITYFTREVDLVPDSLGKVGYTDDAAIVAAVLQRNSVAFSRIAHKHGKSWDTLVAHA